MAACPEPVFRAGFVEPHDVDALFARIAEHEAFGMDHVPWDSMHAFVRELAIGIPAARLSATGVHWAAARGILLLAHDAPAHLSDEAVDVEGALQDVAASAHDLVVDELAGGPEHGVPWKVVARMDDAYTRLGDAIAALKAAAAVS